MLNKKKNLKSTHQTWPPRGPAPAPTAPVPTSTWACTASSARCRSPRTRLDAPSAPGGPPPWAGTARSRGHAARKTAGTPYWGRSLAASESPGRSCRCSSTTSRSGWPRTRCSGRRSACPSDTVCREGSLVRFWLDMHFGQGVTYHCGVQLIL